MRRLVVLSIVLLAMILLTWRESVKTIDGVAVPSHVVADKNMILESITIKRKVTWHAYQKKQGYEWYALRYERERDGKAYEQWAIRGLSTSSDPTRAWKRGLGFDVQNKVFYGSRSEASVRLGGPVMYNIVAAGIVNDMSVVRVVGTAAKGETLSVAPVNTCWFLMIADTSPDNRWVKVEAQDSAGKTLHTLTFGFP